jgi:hypothetical protein
MRMLQRAEWGPKRTLLRWTGIGKKKHFFS